VHWAPGIPHALFRANFFKRLGRGAPRGVSCCLDVARRDAPFRLENFSCLTSELEIHASAKARPACGERACPWLDPGSDRVSDPTEGEPLRVTLTESLPKRPLTRLRQAASPRRVPTFSPRTAGRRRRGAGVSVFKDGRLHQFCHPSRRIAGAMLLQDEDRGEGR
jgi:hypothetical protein